MQGIRRSNESFLRPIERAVLAFLSRRIPSRATPDTLTGIGVFGAVLAAIFYPMTAYSAHFVWIASFGIALNWFGDSLDGTIARERGIERPHHGLLIDHTADLISQVLIGVGFGLTPYIALSSALILLISYLVFVAHTFIRALVFKQVVIAYYNVGPTEVRLMLIVCGIALAYMPLFSRPIIMGLAVSDLVAVGLGILGFCGFLLQAFNDLRTLQEGDTLS